MEQETTLTRQTASVSISATSRAGRAELPGLTILAHPEIGRVGERCVLTALVSGREALLSRVAPVFVPARGAVDEPRPLGDSYLSRDPVRLSPIADDAVRLIVETRKPVHADGEALVGADDFSRDDLERGIVLTLADRVALLLHLLDPAPLRGLPDHDLIGENRHWLDVRYDVTKAADTDVPVLIRGATGTGKELVAQALHRGSRRRDGPFVALNLGAVAPSLASAELFGAVKGAFTGADRRRRGCFERARGGTLFLDEVGEAPVEVQAHLLRALETGRILPVGAEAEVEYEARIVAATDADLESAISAERFRAPLLHRLGGYEIRLPPLARRRDDVGRLLVHFLRLELEALGESGRLDLCGSPDKPWLPAPLVARLARAAWPGNVRQLRNVARRLVIAGRGESRLSWSPRLDALLESGSSSESVASPSPPERVAVSPPEPAAESAQEKRAPHALCRVATLPWETLVANLGGAAPARAFRARFSRVVRTLLQDYGGYEIARREEDLTLLFAGPLDALGWALEFQETVLEWGESTRVAIHLAEVAVRRSSSAETARGARLIELLADAVAERANALSARVLDLATHQQILLTRGAFDLARQSLADDHPLGDPSVRWFEHGSYRVESSPEPIEIFEVGRQDVAALIAPAAAGLSRSPSEISEEEIVEALRASDYNLQTAADVLRISRPSLYKLVEKSSRIRKASDLSAEEITTCRARFQGDLDAAARHLEVSRRGLKRRMTELRLD